MNVPMVVVVPLSRPDELSVNPAGIEAPDHVKGIVPIAWNWKEQGVPLTQFGSGDVDVMNGTVPAAGEILSENAVVPALPAEFIAVTLIELVPASVGVPDKSPLPENVKPVGTPVAVHVGVGLPEAVNWNE